MHQRPPFFGAVCCVLCILPSKVLLADTLPTNGNSTATVPVSAPTASPSVSPANPAPDAALAALREKESLAALATFKWEDLIKRIKEAPPAATPKEIELGEKASKQMDKDTSIKVLDPHASPKNQALYDKLTSIATKLGNASGRPGIKYTVKIIDSDELNAFTLPNGNIYFYRGLLDTLYSDDEIAAVMAHEIGHNVCMHALRGEAKSRKVSLMNLAVLLAALGSGGENAGGAVLFSQYLSVGLMNEYSEEYESEADITGVSELIKAGYNPSAMVTVMKRFAVDENRHPDIQMGVFEDHPEPTERADAIITAIKAAGLEYNPREVNGVAGAEVVYNKDKTTLEFRQVPLMEFPGIDEATKARANLTAKTLNDLLRNNLRYYEIKTSPDGPNVDISARGTTIVSVTPADAALNKQTTQQCATQWRQNLSRLFWRETLDGGL